MIVNSETQPQNYPEHILTLDERALALQGAVAKLKLEPPIDINTITGPEELNAAFNQAYAQDARVATVYRRECKVPRKAVSAEAVEQQKEHLRALRNKHTTRSPLRRFAGVVLDTLGVRVLPVH